MALNSYEEQILARGSPGSFPMFQIRDRVVSIYNIRVGATAIHQMPKGELVDCQIQPPAGEEKVYEARCLRRSEAVVCHTILVAAYPFS